MSEGLQMQIPIKVSGTLIGYARASTEDQTLTLEVQKERIQAYATLRGFDLKEIIVESGVSGGTPLA